MTTRIGVLWPQSASIWTAGGVYYENLLASLRLAGHRDDVVVIEPSNGSFSAHTHSRLSDVSVVTFSDLAPSRSVFGRFLARARTRSGRHEKHFLDALERSGADVLFGDIDVGLDPPLPWVGWIQDFQHLHYPEFFSDREVCERNVGYRLLAEKASLVLLSSNDALGDFRRFAPGSADKGRIAQFVSLIPDEVYADDPQRVARDYGVASPYVVVPNQWWIHKNHEVAIRAAALLKAQGRRVTWVMTGALADYRSPDHISELLQLVAHLGLREQIAILGVLPRADQLSLMMGANCIVHPSLFEGWSTVVEDAKSLGKRIVLSDLAVHREQHPPGATFFDPRSAEQLAEAVTRAIDEQTAEDPETARLASLERARVFGRTFFDICLEAARK